ncbi:MAG TPA: class I SAM-dependent methyltransferase [Bryobacteraceae bacterium]|nr:class I SAM-dependent methyltransferase [Bryobacteraceae bacterium]
MSNQPRDSTFAREIARQHFRRSDPTSWFDVLYREAQGQMRRVPWADDGPNTHLVEWARANSSHMDGPGRTAFVAGCGLGEDAEYLAAHGFDVLAVDISQTAIHWCRDRFPQSRVQYIAADLLRLPFAASAGFDLVLEIYTVQSIPPEWRSSMMEALANLVAPGGLLLSIARGRDEADDPGDMPWPLTRTELGTYEISGLKAGGFDDVIDDEDPPVRRFRSVFFRRSE